MATTATGSELVTLVCPKCKKPIASAVRAKVPKEMLAKAEKPGVLSIWFSLVQFACATCRPIST